MTDRYAALPANAFHLVDAQNWPAIQRDGLYCTAALIARAGLAGAGAAPFAAWRATGMSLPGGAHIRDQSPMPPAALSRCLDPGLTPQAWYDLVNAKVFFWLDRDRLDRHIAACRGRPQVLLTLDLPRLLDRHGSCAYLTPFNTGNARRPPPQEASAPSCRWQCGSKAAGTAKARAAARAAIRPLNWRSKARCRM